MKLPNWFRIAWWLLIGGAITWYLYVRRPELVAGRANAFDIVAFVIWLAILLLPLFQEISLLGITLKQEIEKLDEKITAQVASIRSDLSNAIDVRTSFSPQFHFPAPPTDAQLPKVEERIKAVVEEVLAAQGAKPPRVGEPDDVTEDVELMFRTRYHLERELRRIASRQVGPAPTQRAFSGIALLRALESSAVIDPGLERAVRQVYSVCSPAIHGEPVSDAQVALVRDVGPGLIAALRAID